MKDFNAEADQLHPHVAAIQQAAQGLVPAPMDYAFYLDPEATEDGWHIIFFFADAALLRSAVASGVCYQIQQFSGDHLLQQGFVIGSHTFLPLPDTSHPDWTRYAVQRALLTRREEYQRALTKTDDSCPGCGHPFDQHQLLGHPDASSGHIRHGWIHCPVEGCTCYRTWSIPDLPS